MIDHLRTGIIYYLTCVLLHIWTDVYNCLLLAGLTVMLVEITLCETLFKPHDLTLWTDLRDTVEFLTTGGTAWPTRISVCISCSTSTSMTQVRSCNVDHKSNSISIFYFYSCGNSVFTNLRTNTFNAKNMQAVIMQALSVAIVFTVIVPGFFPGQNLKYAGTFFLLSSQVSSSHFCDFLCTFLQG